MSTPITNAVQAALYYVNPREVSIDKWNLACDTLLNERIDKDRENNCQILAVAARILADEVVRLREKLDTNKTVILNTVLSDCCEAPAVVAGKPGSTQWYACPECCQPCDIFYQDNSNTATQPL